MVEGFAVFKGVQLRKDKVMVARVWSGLTPEAKAPEYQRYLEQTGVKDCLATDGSRGVLVLRRTASEKKAEFLFISFWESLDCIRRFAGTNIDKAVYYPEDREFLLTMDPNVIHYEIAKFEFHEAGDRATPGAA